MRPAPFLSLCLWCASICWAPSATSAQNPLDPQKMPAPSATGTVEKRTERIHIEDAGSSIDELRVGGETQSIRVQPKNHMPAYQIAPTSGERSWKILDF